MDHISTYTAPALGMIESGRGFAKGLSHAKSLTTAQIATQLIYAFGENGAKNIANAILQRI